MAIFRSTAALKASKLAAVVSAAGANAIIEFWSGAVPATAETAPTGTKLGTLTCGSTFGTISGGTLTLNAITGDSSVDATGAWGSFVIKTSGGTPIYVGDVTVTGSGGGITMAAASAVQGATLDLTSVVIAEG